MTTYKFVIRHDETDDMTDARIFDEKSMADKFREMTIRNPMFDHGIETYDPEADVITYHVHLKP